MCALMLYMQVKCIISYFSSRLLLSCSRRQGIKTSIYMPNTPGNIACMVIFADDSLTVDNVTKVMELLSYEGDKLFVLNELGVTESMVQMITRNVSMSRVYVELYLNCHPKPSWKNIAGVLYENEIMAAAAEAKTFYHKNGR